VGDFAPSGADAHAAPALPQPSVDPSEPDIGSVHRAALRYLTLEPSQIAALREGLSRRGWLPILSFRATRDREANIVQNGQLTLRAANLLRQPFGP